MKLVEVVLKPEEAFNESVFKASLYRRLSIKDDGSLYVNVVKRSIDARSKDVVVRIQCEIIPSSESKPLISYSKKLQRC